MNYDVLVISECCCDIIFAGMPRIPQLGEEAYCESFHIKAGGGANTASSLARLGLKTSYLTQMGNDPLGMVLYNEIKASGVDMSLVKCDPSINTAVSAVMTMPSDRCFASYAGSSYSPDIEALRSAIKESRHVHTFIGYSRQFNLPALCKEAGATLSLDLYYGCTMSRDELKAALDGCHIVKMNQGEALALTGEGSIDSAMKVLSTLCPAVIITLGADGCVAVIEDKFYSVSLKKLQNIVDPTGAGDLFYAGYLYGLIKNLSAEECLSYACASGALAATFYGGCDERFSLQNVEDMRLKIVY